MKRREIQEQQQQQGRESERMEERKCMGVIAMYGM